LHDALAPGSSGSRPVLDSARARPQVSEPTGIWSLGARVFHGWCPLSPRQPQKIYGRPDSRSAASPLA
jgi:hypothetical protein